MAVRLRRKKRYQAYLASEEWKNRTAVEKILSGKTCQDCGSTERLETHHLSYANVGREKEGELIVLCRRCHGRRHGYYEEEDMMDFNTRSPGGRLAFLIDEALQFTSTKNEEKRKQTRQARIGASRLGENCARKLQYEYFKAPKDTPFDGKTLRIFRRGHEGERLMAEWLRSAGLIILTEKSDGEQFCFSVAEGKLLGFADGIVTAGPEDLGLYPRLWENKVLGAKGFGKLEKEKVKKAYPVYYGQMQLYMAYFQLTDNPALFTALNANDMKIYAENVAFDPVEAQRLSDRAVMIIKSCDAGQLLPRLAAAKDESWYECKFCDYKVRCWHGSNGV